MYAIDQIGQPLLDDVYELLNDSAVSEGMDKLMFGLLKLRQLFPHNWQQFVRGNCRKHPLKKIVHESPFTHRAFHKPRGYAGDAVMMDYIYASDVTPVEEIVTLNDVYQYELATPGCASVRERLAIAANLIDRVSREVEAPRILSIACGHLREGQRSRAVQTKDIGELIAFDQDEKSLAVVESAFGNGQVRPIKGSVSELLRDKGQFQDMDLVYSLGLFDYLAQPTARRMTRIMFDMLKPGGVMLLVNFSPNLYNIGYMEAYMDWFLIYRDEFDMHQLTVDINPKQMKRARIFRDSYKNLVFMEIRKAKN